MSNEHKQLLLRLAELNNNLIYNWLIRLQEHWQMMVHLTQSMI